MNDSGFKENDMFGLIPEDLPMAQGETTRPLDEVLNELDELIGMRTVKNSIRRLAVQSMFMKQRAAMGAGKVQQMVQDILLILSDDTSGVPELVRASLASKFATLGSLNVEPPRNALEAQGLIDTLFACENAELTAGGKKITVLANIDELEKKFQ